MNCPSVGVKPDKSTMNLCTKVQSFSYLQCNVMLYGLVRGEFDVISYTSVTIFMAFCSLFGDLFETILR